MTQDLVTRLRKLGERRQRHQEEGERLAQEIRLTVHAAKGQVSMVEAANLLGMDRTALYKTYLKR